MTRRIIFTEEARQDLRELVSFWSSNSLDGLTSGRRLRTKIMERVKFLAEFHLGHRYDLDYWYERHVMTFSVKPYRIFYWEDEEKKTIYVLRVLHSARNVDAIMAGSSFPFVK